MKRFSRHIENFVCAHCGADCVGNGYTNHCPKCLWSRHVDNNPGDRAAECMGMMRPITVDVRGGEYIITHKCELCGKVIRQRASENDDTDALIRISTNNDFIFGK